MTPGTALKAIEFLGQLNNYSLLNEKLQSRVYHALCRSTHLYRVKEEGRIRFQNNINGLKTLVSSC
jgi:hypothetical protein